MRIAWYYFAVALCFVVIVWVGWATNKPHDPSARPASTARGQLPAGGLSRNFSLEPMDKAGGVRGEYPPRAFGLAAQRKPPSDSWLLDADSDRERFRRVEVALRGLDVHMAEIGVRFGVMHDAIERGNLPLAALEADKTIESARIAMLKRPGFGGDEGLKYMGAPQWTLLKTSLESGDAARAQTAFLGVRQSCMACHAARGMAFINNSRLFDSTAQFATRSASAAPSDPAAPTQTQGSVQ
jgi:hypothetical protein